MANISNYKKISTTDYEGEDAEMIETLAANLNPFLREVNDVINGNIDFDNLKQNIIQFETTVDATGKPNSNQVNVGVTTGVTGLQVISARSSVNTSSYPTGSPFISFTPSGSNVIIINNISGLPANEKFLLTVIVY
jgi:hypothetical protein